MEKRLQQKKWGITPILSLLMLLSFGYAQAQYTKANTVAAETNVSASGNAVDDATLPSTDERGDLTTFAILNATTASTSSSIDLEFATSVPANKTTFVRISIDPTSSNSSFLQALVAGTLGVSGEIIAPIIDLDHIINVSILDGGVTLFAGSSLDNFNNVSSDNDIKVVQDNDGNYYLAIHSNQSFSNIVITNNGPAIIGASNNFNLNVHGAFYRNNTANCNTPVYTSWDGSGLASVSLLTSPAENISNFIDGDLSTFSNLTTGTVGVAATTTQTVYLEGLSTSSDNYHITLRLPTGLLSVGIAQNITLAGYEGNTFKNSISLYQLLDLNLLNLENNEKVSVLYSPGASIDNIRISISSLVGASLLSGLELYEISKNTTLVTTNYATGIAPESVGINYEATLNGSLENNSCLDSFGFEYSTTPNFAAGTVSVSSGPGFTVNYSENISGLLPNSTYYYRATATSTIDGTNTQLYGNIYSFYTGDIVWNGTVWSNGFGPDATDNGIATINGDYNTGTHGSLAVHDLTINPLYTLTVESTNSFTLSGSITAPDESIDASEGEIIFLGTDNIVLDGDLLVDKDGIADNRNGHQIDKVQVNTTGGAELEVLNEVEVMTSLNLGTEGILALQDDAEIIFNSDGNGTASFGEVGGVCTSSRITYGNDAGVTVERYIPAGSTEGGTVAVRAYRMLTSAVNAGTINSNWQEGDTDATYNTGSNSLGNIVGFGTHITGGSNANGFDYNATNNPSAYTYNNQAQSWSPLANTNATNLNVGDPYYINIRGDRTLDMSTNAPDPISTTIRTKGTLKLCDSDLTSATLADGDEEFSFFGNPYQAPVDMNEVLTNAGTSEINPNFIWVWDPNLSTKGAYVVINVTDNTKSNSSSNANRFLQAGQAIFVANSASMTGSPNLSFEENDKNIEEDNLGVFRPSGASYALNILLKSGANTLDAAVIDFNNDNDNSVNDYDAKKLGNSDENLALVNGNHFLSIEQRDIPVDLEEIPLYVGSYRHQDYQLLINWEGIPNLKAFVVDNYLQTSTALAAGENIINFSIDEQIAASVENDRFKITFEDSSLASNTVEANGFSLYPNPLNNGVLNISNPNYTGEMEVSIFNNVGQLMMMKSHTAITGNTSINMSQLAAGVYLVKVNTENTTFTKKVVNP